MRHAEFAVLAQNVPVVMCLAMVHLPAFGQVATTSMINGTVSDPTGSAIVGAKVTHHQYGNRRRFGDRVQLHRQFLGGGLDAGQYEVAISHPGIQHFQRDRHCPGIGSGVYTVNAA